jgi:hypothetical protein
MLGRGVRRRGIYLIGGRREGGGRGGNVNMRLEMIHMFDVDMVWYTPLILLYGHGHGHGHVVVMSIIVISRLDIRMMSGRDIL